MNNANFGLAVANNARQEMVLAKQTLLAFAMNNGELMTGGTPGRFPCPDSDNDADGLPNLPCVAISRLPRRIDTNTGGPFYISDEGLENGQRFWFAVSPAYRQNSMVTLNSNTNGTLTLDGIDDIVAIIVAPGDALAGQTRHNNTASNYLESTNVGGSSFISSLPANPTAFNDRVLPIYRHEVMTLVTARVVREIRRVLDLYHPANGNTYPADEPAFQAALAAAAPPLPTWFTANSWNTVTNYAFVNTNSFTLNFVGCEIEYTVTFGSPDITRDQFSCEVSP
ncbi:MAG: hypothetical protein Q8S94_09885 [Pseudohongiella sp.]|nr:hypothetical protein [Pseudohongiella sp.]